MGVGVYIGIWVGDFGVVVVMDEGYLGKVFDVDLVNDVSVWWNDVEVFECVLVLM